MIGRQGRLHLPRDDEVATLRGCVSIATAPSGEPVTIAGRVIRITLLPATDPQQERVVVRLTDGSGEAALTFSRSDAPQVCTGIHVVADGMFDAFDQPRAFDPLLLTILDG